MYTKPCPWYKFCNIVARSDHILYSSFARPVRLYIDAQNVDRTVPTGFKNFGANAK